MEILNSFLFYGGIITDDMGIGLRYFQMQRECNCGASTGAIPRDSFMGKKSFE